MGVKGGARPGSGRKRRLEKFAGPIAKAEKRIADRLPTLIDKHFELAEGVSVLDDLEAVSSLVKALEEAGTDPERIEAVAERFRQIYRIPPAFKSLEYLVNRIMGKPTEKVEQETDSVVTINVRYADEPDGDDA